MEALARTLRRRRGARARPASPMRSGCPAAPARKPGRSTSCIPAAISARSCAARRRAMARRRRARPGSNAEAALMQLAYDAGVPSPRVLHVLQPQDELGTGFIMQRVEGETIPRKILRDEQFAAARPKLARQLGGVLAGIHGLPLAQLPELRRMTAAKEIAELERDYRSFDWPRPVFELALRWLRDRDPGPSERGDAGAWRFPPRQSHHRPRRRARGAGLGARAYRRSDGGSGLDLRQFLALRRDRQAGRRFWLARGIVRGLRGGRPPRRSRHG